MEKPTKDSFSQVKISVKREIGGEEEASQGEGDGGSASFQWSSRVHPLRRMSYVHGACHKFNMPSGKAI